MTDHADSPRAQRKRSRAESMPDAVRLRSDHGFVEEVHNKGVFHWVAGEVVTTPATIRLLMERGADVEPIHER